jgi:hypothetical protein
VNLDALRRLLDRHRMAVALWLALLLPCGQATAAAHLLSHLAGPVGSTLDAGSGDAALASVHCDLCLVATAVGTAAPALQSVGVAPPVAGEAAPSAGRPAGIDIPARLAYRSRAPPPGPR